METESALVFKRVGPFRGRLVISGQAEETRAAAANTLIFCPRISRVLKMVAGMLP